MENPDSVNTAKLIKKAPGLVPPIGKLDHEMVKFENEIKSKNLPQLKEMLSKQLAVLKNKTVLDKLPDKGEKLKLRNKFLTEKINQMETEISKDTIEDLEPNNSIDVNEMEWKHSNMGAMRLIQNQLDSDDSDDDEDEDMDNLRIEPEGNQALKIFAEQNIPSKHSVKEMEKDSNGNQFCPFTQKWVKSFDEKKISPKFAPFSSLKHETVPAKMKPDCKTIGSKLQPNDLMPVPTYSHNKSKLIPMKDSINIIADRIEKNMKLY